MHRHLRVITSTSWHLTAGGLDGTRAERSLSRGRRAGAGKHSKAEVEVEFDPEGLRCRIEAPLVEKRLVPEY